MTTEQTSTVIELLIFLGIFALLVGISFLLFHRPKARLAAFLAILGAFFIVWVNLAVGIVGEPDNPANLLFFAPLLVGFIGALLSRFQPGGMVRTMLAMAASQALVAGGSLLAPGIEPPPPVMAIMVMSGVVLALWLWSALLFRRGS